MDLSGIGQKKPMSSASKNMSAQELAFTQVRPLQAAPKPKTTLGGAPLSQSGTGVASHSTEKGGLGSAVYINATGWHSHPDDCPDTFEIKTVDRSLSQAISQARMAKKMTQKDLALKVGENVKIIQEYENGKATPKGEVIVKLDKALGITLPRSKKK